MATSTLYVSFFQALPFPVLLRTVETTANCVCVIAVIALLRSYPVVAVEWPGL